MANIQINQLPSANLPLNGTDKLPMDQGASTVKATIADVVNKVQETTVVNGLDTPSVIADAFTNRPSSASVGTLFVSSSPYGIYRYNGTGWDTVAISSVATPTFQNVIASGNVLTDGVSFENLSNGNVAKIKNDNLTADRDYQLPNTAGTLALTTQLGVQSIVAGHGINVNNTNPSAPILEIQFPTEDQGNKSQDVTINSTSTVYYPSVNAIKSYVDAVAVGLLKDRGNYDASSNVFPSTGGSGSGGAIKAGDLWYISVAGTLGGSPVSVGYSIRAGVDNPGQTSANWFRLNVGLGYVPENVTNKSTDDTFAANSNTLYPSQRAVKTYIANNSPAYTLQQILAHGHDLVGGSNFQGTRAGDGNIGDDVFGFGDDAAKNNTADSVIAMGSGAGLGNTYTNVALFGTAAAADDSNQLVFSNGSTNARISSSLLTGNQKYQLPNASGTLALISDIPSNSGWALTGNAGTTPGTDFIGTTDNNNVIFKANNAEALRLNASNGYVSSPNSFEAKSTGFTSFQALSPLGGGVMIAQDSSTKGYIYLSNGLGDTYIKCSNLTAAGNVLQLPNASGTLALKSDINPFSYETLGVTGTNSTNANLITKSFTNVYMQSGDYVKLPANPSVGAIYYISSIDTNLDLKVCSGSNIIQSAGSNNYVSIFPAGTVSNTIFVFQYVNTSLWITWKLTS